MTRNEAAQTLSAEEILRGLLLGGPPLSACSFSNDYQFTRTYTSGRIHCAITRQQFRILKERFVKPSDQPYLTATETVTRRLYNPAYGDDRYCVCQHSYDRHFDGYDANRACGCKYCDCDTFVEDPTTPTCEEVRPLLAAFSVGNIPKRESDRVSRHLDGCDNCGEELSAIDAAKKKP